MIKNSRSACEPSTDCLPANINDSTISNYKTCSFPSHEVHQSHQSQDKSLFANNNNNDHHHGSSNAIAVLDHSTQTHSIMTDDSASSPTTQAQPSRRHFHTQTYSLSAAEAEVTSFAEMSTSRRLDRDDNGESNDETGTDLLGCSPRDLNRTLRKLTPQSSDDVIESRGRQARSSPSCMSSPLSLRQKPEVRDDAAAEVALPMSENKIDCSQVLSALSTLLSNQLTCQRCAVTTNLPRSSSPPPSADQEPNQNVPPGTLNSTTPTVLENNVEVTPVNNAGDVMRYILHDIKNLRTTYIRQMAAHERDADVKEMQMNERRHRCCQSALTSDHSDQPRTDRQKHYDRSHPRLPTTTSYYRESGGGKANWNSPNTETDHHRLVQRSHDNNLQPSAHRRSSRRNELADNEVDDGNRDRSRTWLPPRRQQYPIGPPVQFMTEGRFDADLTLPPHHHSQQHQQQFHRQGPQQMQFYPHQLQQQRQSTVFRPIPQMAPSQQIHPLIFLPIHHRHQTQQHQKRQRNLRPVSVHHSLDVRPRPSKLVRSQLLTESIKLAKETKKLTTRIYQRQKYVFT